MIWLITPISQNSRTLQRASRLAALFFKQGGKSGQQRAPYFLTGRALIGDGQSTASATENKPPSEKAKTCLVSLPEERVKRWGKSPPPPQRCGGQGKPYGLKDQIDLGQRAARSISFLRKGIPRWVDRWSLGVNQDRDKWQEQALHSIRSKRALQQNPAYRLALFYYF